MKSKSNIACLFFVLSLSIGEVSADSPEFSMKPAANFSDESATPQIIGGAKADPTDWPATFVFMTSHGGGCTSTVVGPNVILTAAHCIADGATGLIELPSRNINVTCHHHPNYVDGVSESDPNWWEKASPDFALCIADDKLFGFDFERIHKNAPVLSKGQTIHLVGFGCNEVGGTDGGFGVLYEGKSVVQEIPSGSNYYTITMGGAAVCFGDSGGGDYILSDPPSKDRRVLMGVTSRGNISTVSLLSTTNTDGFLSWADSFAKQHGTKICGLHSNTNGCRPK